MDFLKSFKASQWKRLGEFISNWIREDAQQKILQGKKLSDKYRSSQYIKYKANDMRRFTDNKRLKAYFAQPITSNETSSVNMTLTGKMLRSLRPRRANRLGVSIGVNKEHEGKILGNRDKFQREVLTLNQKNQDKALEWLLDSVIDPELKRWGRKNITVNVAGKL